MPVMNDVGLCGWCCNDKGAHDSRLCLPVKFGLTITIHDHDASALPHDDTIRFLQARYTIKIRLEIK